MRTTVLLSCSRNAFYGIKESGVINNGAPKKAAAPNKAAKKNAGPYEQGSRYK